MSKLKIVAVAAMLAVVATPALAQQAGRFVIPEGGAGVMSPNDLFGRRLTAIAGAKATRVQWKRAVKAADMINSNRCKDAYLFAVGEQDERLAKRVYEVCTTISRS